MDVFSYKDFGIPPCTYLKRQIQDSRGRKPIHMCTSSDGKYIAVLYVSRSNKSIKKSISHFDKIVSSALKKAMGAKSELLLDATQLINVVLPYTNNKTYLDFITNKKEFDIYDEIEEIDGSSNKLNKLKNYRYTLINEITDRIDLEQCVHSVAVVLYDTFFLNPLWEGLLPSSCPGYKPGAYSTGGYPEEQSSSKIDGEGGRVINRGKGIGVSFVKFSIGDSFILCFIDNILWIIDRNMASSKLDLSNVDPAHTIVDVDLISISKDSDVSINKGFLWEFIIHYGKQYPVKVIFSKSLTEESFHLKSSISLVPNIAGERFRCIISHFFLDSRYLFYTPGEDCLKNDKTWIDESDQLVLLDHLIGVKDANEKFSIRNKWQKPVEKEFYSKFLIAGLISSNNQHANFLLVLSDINGVVLSSLKMPKFGHICKIKVSYNNKYICCVSKDAVVVVRVDSNYVGDSGQSFNVAYQLVLLFVLDSNVDESVGSIVDVSFGGDPLSEWFYVSLYRGASTALLSIYSLKKLNQNSDSCLTKYNKPYLELSLNTGIMPICLQMISIPCANFLLTIPLHSHYIAVFTPEYVENWDNTATLNFMRFPLYSSNKEMVQLSTMWDCDYISEAGGTDKPIRNVLPSLTEPLFSYHRGCTGTYSYIAQLANLNVEINYKYFVHPYCENDSISTIWAVLEKVIPSPLQEIKVPPLRRSRFQSSPLSHESVTEFIYHFLCEVVSSYKKGSLDAKWSQSLVLQNGNHIGLLLQGFECIIKNPKIMYINQLDFYSERLKDVKEYWLERAKERGIAISGKSITKKSFKYLNNTSTLDTLREHCKDEKGVNDKRYLNNDIRVKSVKDNESKPQKRKVKAVTDDEETGLFSIIPKNKLFLSGINMLSMKSILKSSDGLKRNSAEIVLGIFYLKNALERKKIELPPKLADLLNYLAKTSVAHHKHINNT